MIDDGMHGAPFGTADPLDQGADEQSVPVGSLSDDVAALIDDGKTYVAAEMAFQKTRIAYAADRGKSGIAMGVAALAAVHLALIGLVVGLIIALSPLITPWGATALVVGVLLVVGAILALKAKTRFESLAGAFKEASE